MHRNFNAVQVAGDGRQIMRPPQRGSRLSVFHNGLLDDRGRLWYGGGTKLQKGEMVGACTVVRYGGDVIMVCYPTAAYFGRDQWIERGDGWCWWQTKNEPQSVVEPEP